MSASRCCSGTDVWRERGLRSASDEGVAFTVCAVFHIRLTSRHGPLGTLFAGLISPRIPFCSFLGLQQPS